MINAIDQSASESKMAAITVNEKSQAPDFKDNDIVFIHCIDDLVRIPMTNIPMISIHARQIHISFPRYPGEKRAALMADHGGLTRTFIY